MVSEEKEQFFEAVRCDRLYQIPGVLHRLPLIVNETDEKGRTPLFLADLCRDDFVPDRVRCWRIKPRFGGQYTIALANIYCGGGGAAEQRSIG